MGPAVHFKATYAWALDEGYAPKDAERLARADVELDLEHPARRSRKNLSRHFAPTAWLWSRAYMRRALAERSLEDLGRALHCLQDALAHGRLGLGHVLYSLKLSRDPDVWESAPGSIRRRIERCTRAALGRYRSATGGVPLDSEP